MSRERAPQPRIPAPSPEPTRSTMQPSGAPACCACSISTNCSPLPRRSAGEKPFAGERLAIVTNGGGIGVLAVDRLVDSVARSPACRRRRSPQLDRVLPPTWSRGNPVDIIGDAGPDALRGCAGGAPGGSRPTTRCSRSTCRPPWRALPRRRWPSSRRCRASRARGGRHKPVFAVWLAEDERAARAFEAARIPHFATEAEAVRGFMHLVRYREAQDDLMETPDSLPIDFVPDTATARQVVAAALADDRQWLDPLQVQRALAGLRHPGGAGRAGARCRRGGRRRAADPRRGRHGGREDPVSRHRAQIRHRRRASSI